ncbi:MAG: hypothetical protein JWM41_239 [Gemmatimonadetes bacterium]|nr:hypothetical protein [Gemmatimonadota bacterium]
MLALTVVLAIAGCSFPPLNGGPAVRFHGEATDPIGDTASVADARVARPADLVYASVQVTDDALRLTVRFAPHSLDPATTGAAILLDTDLDPETGGRNPGLGADYLVSFHAGARREATIARAMTDAECTPPGIPCRYEPFEHTEVVLSNDEMTAVFPRSALARFDGRLNFLVIAYASLNDGRGTATSDHMPNLPAQFIAVR